MSDPVLDVQGLVGGYGKMTILNGTSFSVPAGSITTVIGPNGAGKSTVFKAIFGLLNCAKARLSSRAATSPASASAQLLTAGICYVPQGRNIFPELTVRHNIELGAVAAGREITDLPARIEAALDKFPVLRKKATQQASTLSGGEQKQLEIVRGLLLDPQLVLIDEPSIGLSPLMVQQTFDILQAAARPWRLDPDDRAERALGAGDLRLSASCSNSARPAFSTRPSAFSTIPASASCSSAARWRPMRHERRQCGSASPAQA